MMTPYGSTRPGALLVMVLAVGALLETAAGAAAQAAGDRPPRWEVEAVGGYASIKPGALNSQADYDTTVLDYLRAAQIQQTHEGALEKLDHTFPVGARVVRRIGQHWSAGIGFVLSEAERRSSARASYAYNVVDPRAQEYHRSFSETITVDPFMLRIRAYLPHGLVRYDRTLWRRLRVGTSLEAGWLVADGRIERTRTMAGGFNAIRREGTWELSGRGHCPAAGAWLTTRVAVTRRWGLLVEGGYAWQQVKNVTGSAKSTTVTQDGEASEVELTQTSQGEGRWISQTVTYQTATGRWQGTIPTVGGEGSPAMLSLSGWQVKLGISLGL